MVKHFVLLAGLLSGLSVVACSDRASDLVAPFRQNAITVGDSIFIHSGDGQVGRAEIRLAKGLQIIVRNNGAPVADARGTFTVTSGGGTVSRAAFRTNASGIAQFTWTLGASGPQQVTASLNGGNAVVFNATVIPVGSTLTIINGNGQTALPGDTLAGNLFVELRDPIGTPIPGATVRYTTVPSHGGAAKFLTRTTNTAGRALNRWMLGWGASAQTLKAFVPGVDTVVFNATASTAGVTFEILSGDAQTANAGSTLPSSIVVQLKKNGIPVEGVRGTFDVITGGGIINRNSFTTNALGRGTVSWTLGTTALEQQLNISIGAVGVLHAAATANPGTFLTNLTSSRSSVMSRHYAHEREIVVSFKVSSTVPTDAVFAYLEDDAQQEIRGNGCSVRSSSSWSFSGTCTITVTQGLPTDTYPLAMVAHYGASQLARVVVDTVHVDDTSPLVLSGATLSRTTVSQSDSTTWTVVAGITASSSKQVSSLSAHAVKDGIVNPACTIYSENWDATHPSPMQSGACSMGFRFRDPGSYDMQFSATDRAGNLIYHTIPDAILVVP